MPPTKPWQSANAIMNSKRSGMARSTFGGAEIPFGACVEIDLITEAIDLADASKGT